MQKNKMPERMCIGCREQKEKLLLCRVVRDKEGSVSLDLTGKKPGRGAYICKKLDCFKKARQKKRLEASLECSIPEEVYDRLEEELTVEK